MSGLTDDKLWATYEQSIKKTWASCGDFKQEVTIALRAVADAAVAAYVVDHIPDAKKMVEPFGYFRSEPFGWTDCAPDDEGAVALYERPHHSEDKL